MPRRQEYRSNAERQRAYRLRLAKQAAEALAENAALRKAVGADEDDTLYEATEALTQAELAQSPGRRDDQTAAAFAVGHQTGYDAGYELGYQDGYAAAAKARLEELLQAPTPPASERRAR